jgi:hypothetical protein
VNFLVGLVLASLGVLGFVALVNITAGLSNMAEVIMEEITIWSPRFNPYTPRAYPRLDYWAAQGEKLVWPAIVCSSLICVLGTIIYA